jgi:hypothetical protein
LAVLVHNARDAVLHRVVVIDIHGDPLPRCAGRSSTAGAHDRPIGTVKSIGARQSNAGRRTGDENYVFDHGSYSHLRLLTDAYR